MKLLRMGHTQETEERLYKQVTVETDVISMDLKIHEDT